MAIGTPHRGLRSLHRFPNAAAVGARYEMSGPNASARADDVAQGRRLYLEYCSSCHGLTGEGDGPVAPALTTPPANLRRLSKRFGNPLPEDQVARFIDGRVEVKAYGPRGMPVWGARF